MDEFALRRRKLAELIEPSSVAILVGSKIQYRNSDVEFEFRQNSNVYYLSGIKEPEIVLILQKDTNDKLKYIIFYKTVKKDLEIWFGKAFNANDAVNKFGADVAYSTDMLSKKLPLLIANNKNIYYSFNVDKNFDNTLTGWLNLSPKKVGNKQYLGKHVVYDLNSYLHEMRVIKSRAEIKYISKAANISAMAHNSLIKYARLGLKEYNLTAKFEYIVKNKGCESLAYPTIVGAGNNACILHYTKNNCELKNNDLVLVDAGCEYNYYASDITRTFPVNKKFTPYQKDLYNLVLLAQKEGIALIKPNNTWKDVSDKIIEIIVAGLKDLNLIKGSNQSIIKNNTYKNYYLHGFGHFLGLDVHDVGENNVDNKSRKFEAGMVLTVEPGLYISNDNYDAPSKWRGIGVRIEDIILVTSTGNKNLSKKAIKEVDEIEAC